MTFCFGKSPNYLVVKFCTEGGEYFPVIIMDEKSEFPLSCDELTNFANWCKKMCQFLEKGLMYETENPRNPVGNY